MPSKEKVTLPVGGGAPVADPVRASLMVNGEPKLEGSGEAESVPETMPALGIFSSTVTVDARLTSLFTTAMSG